MTERLKLRITAVVVGGSYNDICDAICNALDGISSDRLPAFSVESVGIEPAQNDPMMVAHGSGETQRIHPVGAFCVECGGLKLSVDDAWRVGQILARRSRELRERCDAAVLSFRESGGVTWPTPDLAVPRPAFTYCPEDNFDDATDLGQLAIEAVLEFLEPTF